MTLDSLGAGLPLIRELSPLPDVESAFLRFSQQPNCVFLDSALRHRELGRYSYLTADPIVTHIADGSAASSFFDDLAEHLHRFHADRMPGLPPFQGGWVGMLSYDLHRGLENISPPKFDEFAIPVAWFGCYDIVLAFDHLERRAWLISHGFPESEIPARRRRAAARLEQAFQWLGTPPRARGTAQAATGEVARCELAPYYAVPGPAELTSNFSAPSYLAAVEKCIEYIHAGDIFQVNFSQRLLYPAHGDAPSLYLRLRDRNPATFAAYLDGGNFQIASASPERYLQVENRVVQARPIKGTRRRSLGPEADLFRGDELLASEKDRAENIMIVDLLRNDLSRVCDPDSIYVAQLCGLENYQYVQHLVSVVQGTLAREFQPIDAVKLAFPGGSITGAPKVRAMEIIAELEPTARGPYCGSLGYIGFDGNVDFNILIRTITVSRGWWQLPVGGGIVAQSNPSHEYEETWHKAEGMLRALVE